MLATRSMSCTHLPSDRARPSPRLIWARRGSTHRRAKFAHEREPFEARPQALVRQPDQHAVNDAGAGTRDKTRGVRVTAHGVRSRERGVRTPELSRVADGLSDRPCLAERVLRVGPAPCGGGDFAGKPPAFDKVLPRVRARGELQTALGVAPRLVEIALRERQLAQARGKSDRVPE